MWIFVYVVYFFKLNRLSEGHLSIWQLSAALSVRSFIILTKPI